MTSLEKRTVSRDKRQHPWQPSQGTGTEVKKNDLTADFVEQTYTQEHWIT